MLARSTAMVCSTEMMRPHAGLAVAAVALLPLACTASVTVEGDPSAQRPVGAGGGIAVCPDAELVATVGSLHGVAVTEGHVFWMDAGDVYGAEAIANASAEFLVSVGGDDIVSTGNRLAVDDSSLYASGDQGIFRVDLAGSNPPVVLAPPLARIEAMAATSAELFIGRQHWVSDFGSLFRVSLAGGAPELLHAEGFIHDLAVEGDDVYWSDGGSYSGPAGSQVYDDNGRIGRLDVDGDYVFVQGLSSPPFGLAVDPGSIYWADYQGGVVQRIPKDGGGSSATVADAELVRDLVVTPEGMYVAQDSPAEIRVVPVGSDQPACLARVPAGVRGKPTRVLVDNSFVYVATRVPGEYDGAVLRAPRLSPVGDETP